MTFGVPKPDAIISSSTPACRQPTRADDFLDLVFDEPVRQRWFVDLAARAGAILPDAH